MLQILFFVSFSIGFVALTGYYLYRRFLLPFAFPGRVQRGLTAVFFGLVLLTMLAPGAMALARLQIVSTETVNLLLEVGYLLMGFFSVLLGVVVAGDLLLFLRWLLWKNVERSRASLEKWTPRGHRVAALLLTIVLTVAGFVNAKYVEAHEVVVRIPRLPLELYGFRIALLSDVHAGLDVDRDYVMEVVEKTNEHKPDMVVLVGDVADGQPSSVAPILQPLSSLSAPFGMFYVTGNHEYYWGDVSGFEDMMRHLGFAVLINEHALVRKGMAALVIGGVPDLQAKQRHPEHEIDLEKTFRDAPSDANSLRVLLAHQPKVAEKALAFNVQLQLSGHTHGGQFFPWTVVIPLVQRFVRGLYDFEGMKIFVGTGAGGWGPPLRLGSTAEIPILILEPSN